MLARRLRKEKTAVLGICITCIFVLLAIIGPYVIPYDPFEPDLGARLLSFSVSHLLGTDELGRDVLSRLVVGSRISLIIGMLGSLFSLLIGVVFGCVSGIQGGWVDTVIMRGIDVLLAFPGILLAIMIVAIIGTGVTPVIVAAGFSGIPSFSRTVRSCVLSIKENSYVESARAIGVTPLRLVIRHVLPNAVSPIIVLTTLNIGMAILTASGLSFLGLGVQPPAPEWGAMISTGRTYMRVAPYLIAIPGTTLFLVVLGFNLLGDGLRDVLDPYVIQGQ